MAKLTYKARKRLKKSAFAIPSKREYPIEDTAHARNALGKVSRFGTPTEKKQVRAAVAKRYKSIVQTKGPQAKKSAKKK